MFILLNCNKAMYMYRPMTLSCYMYLYYNFSSDAPTPRSSEKLSCLSFVFIHSIVNSFLWSHSLHHTMQQRKRLQATNPDRHADRDLSDLEASANIIPYCTVCSANQKYTTTYWTTLMLHLSQDLNSWVCPSTFLSVLETLASSKAVRDPIGFICRSECGARLLSTHATDVRHWHDICSCIFKGTSAPNLYPFY